VEARLLPLKQIPPRSCGDEKGKIMKNFFKFLKSDSFCDFVMMGGYALASQSFLRYEWVIICEIKEKSNE
jgi:hypothetical protein